LLRGINASSYFSKGITSRIGFPLFSIDSTDENAIAFDVASPVLKLKDIQEAVSKHFLVVTRSDYGFIPSDVEAFNQTAFFATADTNRNGEASLDELKALFVYGFWDGMDEEASKARSTALDMAVFSCVGANAEAVSESSFDCILDAMTLYLPTSESLAATKARYTSALESGAQVISTKFVTAPFTGAPSSKYWRLDMSTRCNSVTTCDCDLTTYVASDVCKSAAGHITGAASMTTTIFVSSLLLLAAL
jgi:hypothetical protein